MRKVFASGVFDRLHNGHLHYLREAKKLGDCLIVCVANDSTAKKSGKRPILNEAQRTELVRSLKFVDDAFVGKDLGKGWTIYDTIEEVRPDIIALGFDQTFDEKELEKGCTMRGMKVKVVRVSKLSGVKKEKNGKIITV